MWFGKLTTNGPLNFPSMWFGKLTMLGSSPNHTNGISITYTVRPERACAEFIEASKGLS